MAQNYISSGDQVKVVLTSGQTGFASGSAYKVGTQVGVILSLTRGGQTVMNDVASAEGDIAVVALEGVFSVPKEAPLVIALGDRLYWDATAGKFTKTATANTFAGFAHEAAGSADTTVKIRLVSSDATSTGLTQAANVAALAGTLTGTTDGTLEDVADIALSTSDTYTDDAVNTAVNAAILDINLQLKELQTKLNAEIAALKASGLQASS